MKRLAPLLPLCFSLSLVLFATRALAIPNCPPGSHAVSTGNMPGGHCEPDADGAAPVNRPPGIAPPDTMGPAAKSAPVTTAPPPLAPSAAPSPTHAPSPLPAETKKTGCAQAPATVGSPASVLVVAAFAFLRRKTRRQKRTAPRV